MLKDFCFRGLAEKRYSQMAEKITELSADDARKFFLNAKCYSTIDLPKYFDFQPLLDKLSAEMMGIEFKHIQNTSPKCYDNVNYKFYQNKDGNLAWRKMEIINPVLYIKLVNIITEPQNWLLLQTHFRTCSASDKIECHSIPFDFETSNISANSVINWWERIEQQSIELSLKYEWLANTDITDCYGALYTHSIVWALHTKPVAKQNTNGNSLLGNKIDTVLEDMNFRQTNGIPQGSILMDFIAEIVLGYADTLLLDKIGNSIFDFKILRYRDDYRIFTKTKEDAVKILRFLSEVLTDLNFKLNNQKTFVTQELITDSIKPDKLYWNSVKQEESSLQKHLLIIHKLSKEYPNSGSISRALTEFMGRITPNKIQNQKLAVLVAVLVDIALHNSKVYGLVAATIAKIAAYEPVESNKKELYQLVAKKMSVLPNIGYLLVWLQRMVIKDNFEIDECKEEALCQIVSGTKNVCDLWENSWLNDTFKNHIKNTPIINQRALDSLPVVPDDDEVKLFINKY